MDKKCVMKNVVLVFVVVGVLLLTRVSAAPWSGAGTEGDPFNISNCTGLQNMSLNLSSYFQLVNDVDCSDTTSWNSGEGFYPIGDSSTKFTGGFDGQNHTIAGLFINRSTRDYAGLFGYVDGANVSNVGLTSVDISGDDRVGGLVGYSYNSTVNNSYVTGSVGGENYVGGLVGFQETSRIDNSYATGNVDGDLEVGGLVGENGISSAINNSYATGNVDGDNFVGGLIGFNIKSAVDNSYATGSAEGVSEVGGLIGHSYDSNISNSYAVGDVAGNEVVGGFIGRILDANINNSFSTGAVDGGLNSGGFIGISFGDVNIANSYWYNNTGDDASVCIGSDVGHACNSGAEADDTYFYNVSNEPMVSWKYPPWDGFCDDSGHPSLSWQGLVSAALCPGYVAPVIPSSGGSGSGGCVPDSDYDWNCSSWGVCVDGEEARTCNENNNCGNDWGSPEIVRTCVVEEAVLPEQLFDIRMELQNTLLLSVSDLEMVASFFSFGTIPTSVDLTYIILDENGGEVHRESGDISVITQEVLRKSFEGLELPEGKYTFVLETLYGDNVFDEFSQGFEVRSERRSWLWLWTLVGVLIVGVILFMMKYKARRVE